jgi:hypothetical protein
MSEKPGQQQQQQQQQQKAQKQKHSTRPRQLYQFRNCSLLASDHD